MKTLFLIVFTTITITSFAQSACEKDFNLSMQIGYQMSAKLAQPSFTADFGLTGEKSPLCFYGGVRSISKDFIDPNFAKTKAPTDANIALIPTFTTMYKWKRDYYESKLVHCLAAQVGTNNFYAVEYRCYLATGETGRGTIGLTLGYNSYQTLNVGVSVVGIF